ncbi:MAG: hypothetical protein ACRECZ_09230 [Methylocella sp.]
MDWGSAHGKALPAIFEGRSLVAQAALSAEYRGGKLEIEPLGDGKIKHSAYMFSRKGLYKIAGMWVNFRLQIRSSFLSRAARELPAFFEKVRR